MPSYLIHYKVSPENKFPLHPSYLQLIQTQLDGPIQKILSGHQYPAGEYEASLILRQPELQHQAPFSLWITMCKPGGVRQFLGTISVSYTDKELKKQKKSPSCKRLQPEIDISGLSARVTITDENLSPSKQEFESQSKKSEERFQKETKKGVRFPYEILCEWPDVIFAVHYAAPVTEDLKAKTLTVFEQFVEKHNRRALFGASCIHDVFDVTDEDFLTERDEKAAYVFIDFGNCDPAILSKLFRHLSKSDLPIQKLTLT